MVRSRRTRGRFGRLFIVRRHTRRTDRLRFADIDKESGIQLHDSYRTESIMGAHMCSELLGRTENSLWEHYNELMAKLDARQEAAWHEMANTVLIFVRLPLSLYFPYT